MPREERPLDAGDDELLRFAADLRRLRAEAGGPPYRELGRRVHFSAAALCDAAGGRRLPSLAVTTAYVRACGGPVAEWERRWHDLVATRRDPPPATAPPVAQPEVPTQRRPPGVRTWCTTFVGTLLVRAGTAMVNSAHSESEDPPAHS
ncbi:helix-turn-helix domain-containing protein [Saccharothrix sp. Mg75]|uniref:helix-turn-helix domain-containing protein n=1 Tax=Saccharothrix sp. Mg75 TaxID=3445357 RepID=UPI003EEC95A9